MLKSYKQLWFYFIPLLLGCKVKYAVEQYNTSLYTIEQSTGVQDTITEVEHYLAPYRMKLQTQMSEVIGEASAEFTKEKNGGSLGALIVQAMYWFANNKKYRLQMLHGAITNPGGIRLTQIPKGPIQVGKIYELLPFDNELVILTLNTFQWNQWQQHMESKGGWPMSHKTSSFQATEQTTYTLATNDYLANGGDNCEFLRNCPRVSTTVLMRDVLIQYIKAHKTITPVSP